MALSRAAALFSKARGLRRFFFFSAILLLCLPSLSWAGAGHSLESLVENGGILLTRGGATLYAHNQDRPFIPASVLKIGTALAAIELLGREYRFTTRFYYNPDHDLYIRGLADPLLISEEVARIVAVLRSRGLTSLRNIVVDETGCRLENKTEGATSTLNPYDAQNGCLAVNFNTIHLVKGKDGSVHSAEEQTPTLPLMRELARGLPPGTHRLNATAGGDRSLRLVGELFAAMCKEQGVTMRGRIIPAPVPEGLKLFYEHTSSRSLDEVLAGLLKYSNNFIANQLFLAMAAKQYGWPATWDKGQRAVTSFYRNELGLSEKDIVVSEGSGLSRENRLTPKALIAILAAFKPYAGLLPAQDGVLLKSGTMTGIYAYAGYFPAGDRLDSFVVILNQRENNRDRVLALLRALHEGGRAGKD